MLNSRFFYILAPLFLWLVASSVWSYKNYSSLHTLRSKNYILLQKNNAMSKELQENSVKLAAMKYMLPVKYCSAMIDYRLGCVPGLTITYSDTEEKDGFLSTYKTILYSSAKMVDIIKVIDFIQRALSSNLCFIYKLEIKKVGHLFQLVVDFYCMSSNLIVPAVC